MLVTSRADCKIRVQAQRLHNLRNEPFSLKCHLLQKRTSFSVYFQNGKKHAKIREPFATSAMTLIIKITGLVFKAQIQDILLKA